MLRDYKVRFRREESLATIALNCRRLARNENAANFDVVEFTEHTLPLQLNAIDKGPLHFSFFDASEKETPAYVKYQPLTLHIDNEIWELAKLGEPDARFIVAHEIGHIILHDHHAQAFSKDASGHIQFVQKEERAEWQANTFASYLLLSPRVLEAFDSIESLAISCSIPRTMATERWDAANEEKRRMARCARAKGYLGDSCTECGNFTLLPVGLNSKCDTCGDERKLI